MSISEPAKIHLEHRSFAEQPENLKEVLKSLTLLY